MSLLEGEELDAVQQSSPALEPEADAAPQLDAQVAEGGDATDQREAGADAGESDEAGQHPEGHDDGRKPHPLAPDGDRFKQVYARSKAAEARAKEVEAALQQEREARIRLEERLKVKDEAPAPAKPQYTWPQLQAAIDAGQIDMAKALEIRDQQLLEGFRQEQTLREAQARTTVTVLTEMQAYKQLVPNILVPGSEERRKVETEYGYLVQRLGDPTTESKKVSMELAAIRAALGDVETIKKKQTLQSKPLTREPYMETSGASRKVAEPKKDYKSSLSPREVQHYERLMKAGRYPGGWDDVKKEHEEYVSFKAGRA